MYGNATHGGNTGARWAEEQAKQGTWVVILSGGRDNNRPEVFSTDSRERAIQQAEDWDLTYGDPTVWVSLYRITEAGALLVSEQ